MKVLYFESAIIRNSPSGDYQARISKEKPGSIKFNNHWAFEGLDYTQCEIIVDENDRIIRFQNWLYLGKPYEGKDYIWRTNYDTEPLRVGDVCIARY